MSGLAAARSARPKPCPNPSSSTRRGRTATPGAHSAGDRRETPDGSAPSAIEAGRVGDFDVASGGTHATAPASNKPPASARAQRNRTRARAPNAKAPPRTKANSVARVTGAQRRRASVVIGGVDDPALAFVRGALVQGHAIAVAADLDLGDRHLHAGRKHDDAVGALFLVMALSPRQGSIVAPTTNALAPALTVVVSLIAYQTLPTPYGAIGIVLALVGSTLMVYSDEKRGEDPPPRSWPTASHRRDAGRCSETHRSSSSARAASCSPASCSATSSRSPSSARCGSCCTTSTPSGWRPPRRSRRPRPARRAPQPRDRRPPATAARALDGADYVINVDPGRHARGHRARLRDPGAVRAATRPSPTPSAIGGIFRGLRTFPVLAGIARGHGARCARTRGCSTTPTRWR